jgi:hypothetical protein
MVKDEIKSGLKVIDKTLNVTYTWVSGWTSLCSFCNYPDSFLLIEDEPIVNSFGDSYRGKYCVDCAGLESLEPIVKAV